MKKWKAILKSSRFRVGVAGVLLILANEGFGIGISGEATTGIVGLIIAFIVGRTFKPDEEEEEPDEKEEEKEKNNV